MVRRGSSGALTRGSVRASFSVCRGRTEAGGQGVRRTYADPYQVGHPASGCKYGLLDALRMRAQVQQRKRGNSILRASQSARVGLGAEHASRFTAHAGKLARLDKLRVTPLAAPEPKNPTIPTQRTFKTRFLACVRTPRCACGASAVPLYLPGLWVV